MMRGIQNGYLPDRYVPAFHNRLKKSFPEINAYFIAEERRTGTTIYQQFRRQVQVRDEFHCQKCGSNSNLHVHHILPWILYPNFRFHPHNGMTLCQSCHVVIHRSA